MGHSNRKFGLIATKGTLAALNLERQALEFQTPVEYVRDSVHPGTEPWEKSPFEIGPENVIITALKRAQSGERLIVRLLETGGRATTARMRNPAVGWEFSAPIAPRSITTVEISDPASAGAKWKVVSAVER